MNLTTSLLIVVVGIFVGFVTAFSTPTPTPTSTSTFTSTTTKAATTTSFAYQLLRHQPHRLRTRLHLVPRILSVVVQDEYLATTTTTTTTVVDCRRNMLLRAACGPFISPTTTTMQHHGRRRKEKEEEATFRLYGQAAKSDQDAGDTTISEAKTETEAGVINGGSSGGVEDGRSSSSSSIPSSSSTKEKEWSIIRQAVQPQQRKQQEGDKQEGDQEQGLRLRSVVSTISNQVVTTPSIIQRTSPVAEYLIFTFPILMAAVSLETHRSFALEFHNVCDWVTKNGWDDGLLVLSGQQQSQQEDALGLVRSGLNGPVVTSIAILFGTLVANTISTLIDRNLSIQRCGIAMGEEIRMTRLMLDSFSYRYRDEGNRRLNVFVEEWLADFWSGSTTIASLRKLTPYLEDCIRLIHDANRDSTEQQSGAAIGEAYTSLTKLRSLQAETMAQSQRSYPWFHYANLIVLGFGICVIFLIDTDPDTVQNDFSAEPQLALSWSLLVGTLSMLFVVVCDLTSPLAGITRQIFASDDLSLKQIEVYVRCWNTPTPTDDGTTNQDHTNSTVPSSSSSSSSFSPPSSIQPCDFCNEDAEE